jgi:hypothetical protein
VVACPLGRDPCSGVAIIGCTCTEYSIARRQASPCFNRISTKFASRQTAPSSSIVQRERSGRRKAIDPRKIVETVSCARISDARSGRRSAYWSRNASCVLKTARGGRVNVASSS